MLNATEDITTLISKIKTAKVSQKRVLINQLKLKLRSVNKQKRINIINQFKQYRNRHHNHNLRKINNQTKQHNNIQNISTHQNHSQQQGKKH
jgi:hypothetical protein